VNLQRSQRRNQLCETNYGPLPGKDLLHQKLVDFRVPIGASVFHHYEVSFLQGYGG
jgi:hypothetical protein